MKLIRVVNWILKNTKTCKQIFLICFRFRKFKRGLILKERHIGGGSKMQHIFCINCFVAHLQDTPKTLQLTCFGINWHFREK